MALRITGDPELGEVPVAQFAQQRRRVRVRTGLDGVAGRHEHVAHTRGPQPGHDLVQMLHVAHEPRRHVRHDLVPLRRELLGDRQRGLQAARRRRGHGHLDVARDMRDDLVPDPVHRDHLVPDHAADRSRR